MVCKAIISPLVIAGFDGPTAADTDDDNDNAQPAEQAGIEKKWAFEEPTAPLWSS